MTKEREFGSLANAARALGPDNLLEDTLEIIVATELRGEQLHRRHADVLFRIQPRDRAGGIDGVGAEHTITERMKRLGADGRNAIVPSGRDEHGLGVALRHEAQRRGRRRPHARVGTLERLPREREDIARSRVPKREKREDAVVRRRRRTIRRRLRRDARLGNDDRVGGLERVKTGVGMVRALSGGNALTVRTFIFVASLREETSREETSPHVREG